MPQSRRRILMALSGIATAGVGYYTLTSPTKASVNIDGLRIPNKSKTVSGPVSGVHIEVDAHYKWTAEAVPTRAVLRLEGTTTDEYTQLAATGLSELEKRDSGTTTLKGNLLDLPGLTAPDLTPAEVGTSTSETVTFKLSLEVYRNGRELKTKAVKDTATLKIAKGTAEIIVSLGGSGSITVSES